MLIGSKPVFLPKIILNTIMRGEIDNLRLGEIEANEPPKWFSLMLQVGNS